MLSLGANTRIGIDARTIADEGEITGVGMVTYLLVRYLNEQKIGCTLFYDQEPNLKFSMHTPVVLPSRSRPIWEQMLLPTELDRRHIDLFHATWNYGLPWRATAQRTNVVTVHDLIPFDHPPHSHSPKDWLWWRYYYWAVRTTIRSSDAIICVSRATQARVNHYFPTESHKSAVIYPALHPQYLSVAPQLASPILERYKLTKPYFLYLGGLDKRKNIPAILAALAQSRLPNQLVITGRKNQLYPKLQMLGRQLQLAPNQIIFTDYVPTTDLPTLIGEASAMIYPSFAEGFGYPVLEALSLGTPIITTRLPSIDEIAGDLPYYITTDNVSGIEKQLQAVLHLSISEKRSLKRQEQTRAQSFNYQQMGTSVVDLYERLLGTTHES